MFGGYISRAVLIAAHGTVCIRRNWNARASARKGPERFKEILSIKLHNQLGVCMLIPYIIPSTRSSFGAFV